MKHFTCVQDVANPAELIANAIRNKKQFTGSTAGAGKTLGLVFMNPSLRTRLSTQKAAQRLGMNCIVLNMQQEAWSIETEDGVIMNGNKTEHIREAAAVIGTYCDFIGIRSFPSLINQKEDDSEKLLVQFLRHSGKPIISLESATLHPLQSLADMMTITENKKTNHRPKVVLSWAPHIKPVPQCVANSFSQWMPFADADFVIACPEEVVLNEEFTSGATILYNQEEAIRDADFIYVKSWASYQQYGQLHTAEKDWMLNRKKLESTADAKIMHCLPVRRDLELGSDLIDSKNSLIMQQVQNREWAAIAVLQQMINYQDNVSILTQALQHA